MKVLKKGDYKDPNWSLNVVCNGAGWYQNGKRPCYSALKLDSADIVKREYVDAFASIDVCYGFICSECHCFTEIDKSIIPDNVKHTCMKVAAKGSDAYKRLSDTEKKLSEHL